MNNKNDRVVSYRISLGSKRCDFLLSALPILLMGVGLLLKGKKILGDCLNSDSLYLTSVYKDLFQEGGRLSEWILSPAPCYFPDMLLYFPLLRCTPDFGLGMVGYGFVYVFLLLGAILVLAGFLEIPWSLSLRYGSLSLLLWIAVLHDPSRFMVDEFLLVAGRHGGTVISGLLLLILQMYAIRNGYSWLSRCGMVLLAWGAMSSDILILVQWILPMEGVLIGLASIKWIRFRTVIQTTLLFILAYIGYQLTSSLQDSSNSLLVYSGIAKDHLQFGAGVEHIRDFLFHFTPFVVRDKPAFGLLLLAWLVGLFVFFLSLLSGKLKDRDHISTQALMFLSLFSFLSVLITILAPVLGGLWHGNAEIRYILPVFFLPLLNLTFFVLMIHRRIGQIGSYLLFGIILLFGMVRMLPDALALRWNDLKLPYPDMVRFVDDTVREYRLKSGYCDYWNANYLFVLSRSSTRFNADRKSVV